MTEKSGLIVGARTFPGNPYDGHTLAGQLEQTRILLESVPGDPKPVTVLTDLGYRGVDVDIAPAKLIHRGKYKTLSARQRKWLKRRQAVEPVIGHVKADHGLRRCWLKGATGDALHAVLCAAGFNLRWLLRAIARMGIKPVWLRSLFVVAAAVLHMIVSLSFDVVESRSRGFEFRRPTAIA
ncbi:transposase [Burkholderia ubonensis]|nr:transposase [Burkholderia ubonensis]KWC26535.1 transposase [Burkholderia ubonensis]